MYQRIRMLYKAYRGKGVFKYLEKYKEKYNNWYWSERTVRKKLVMKKKARSYYIIRRYASNMGIGSYILSTLSHIRYALDNDFLPVVDMKHYNSTSVDNRKCNTWELFFVQPCGYSLDEAYNSKEYILSDGIPKNKAPNDTIDFLNSDEFAMWQELFRGYAVFNEKTKSYFAKEYESLIKGKRVLGVLCRGTDYTQLKPKGHPIQPDIHSVISSIDEAIEKEGFEYVYLATEDKEIRDELKKIYGTKLIENQRKYKHYKDGYIANTSNSRDNDAFLTSREYLSSLFLLSKCEGLISGRTSGLVIVLLMNNEYKYKYIWDLGNYT